MTQETVDWLIILKQHKKSVEGMLYAAEKSISNILEKCDHVRPDGTLAFRPDVHHYFCDYCGEFDDNRVKED